MICTNIENLIFPYLESGEELVLWARSNRYIIVVRC